MQINNTLERVGHAAVDACTSAARVSRRVADRGLQLVRKNPRTSMVGALALGALAAWMLWHQPGSSPRPMSRRARH